MLASSPATAATVSRVTSIWSVMFPALAYDGTSAAASFTSRGVYAVSRASAFLMMR